MTKEKNKLLWITGMKGIASIMVYIHHFFFIFYPIFSYGYNLGSNKFLNIIIKTPLNILAYAGNSSVCLFYLISGFLIAYTYFNVNNSSQKTSSIFKRYFNLMIPVLLSNIIIFLILKSEIFRTGGLLDLYHQKGLNIYYNNINVNFLEVIKDSVFGVFSTGGSQINPPLWTMKNELLFSILTMMILSVFGKHKSRFFVYAFLIIFSLNGYFPIFILGVILFELYSNKKIILEKINKIDIKIFILLLGIYLSSFTYIAQQSKVYSLLNFDTGSIDKNILFHGLGVFLILLFVLLSDFSKKILSSKIFVKMGNLSLNIYLFHWVIINTFSIFIVANLLNYFNYLLSVLISLLISTVIVLIVSKYFDKYIKNITKYCSDAIVKILD